MAANSITVVFDFDKTIVEPDTDNWVIDQFGATSLFNELLPTMPWNPLMDRMMMEFHSQEKSIEDVKEALHRVPVHPRIVSAIQTVHHLGCELRIVSDANTFFIETILDHLGVRNCFSEINTNPSYVNDEGRLRISPYVDFQSCPHACSFCPPNMCKGMIIENIQASISQQGKTIIYIGDGPGDFCPTLKLKEGDAMMPRKDYPVWDLICNNREVIKPEIHEWNNGEDLERILVHLVEKKMTVTEDSNTTLDETLSKDCKFPMAAAVQQPVRVNQ